MGKSRNLAELLDNNGDVNPAALDTQPQLGRRNLIINGGFDLWQRGISGSFTAGPTYVSADRWYGYVSSSTTVTLSRQAFATGQTEVPNNPKYYARLDWLGTGSSVFFSMSQRIEDVQHGAGGAITLSFYARTEQGDDIVVGINQKFGSGGSSDVTVTNTAIDTTASWQKYVVTVDVPSIAGKTIGTGNNLEITFYRNGTLNSYLDIANVQLELGSVATPFEHRSYGEELLLCQRFYQKTSASDEANVLNRSWDANNGLMTHSKHTGYYDFVHLFPVEMRASPNMSFFAQSGTGYLRIEIPGVTNKEITATPQGFSATKVGMQIRYFLTGQSDRAEWESGSGNAFGRIAYVADAEL